VAESTVTVAVLLMSHLGGGCGCVLIVSGSPCRSQAPDTSPLLRTHPQTRQVGFKPTGRVCSQDCCKAPLVDHILDWEDALPPAELKATEQHGSAAVSCQALGGPGLDALQVMQ
jgi:hypothetical protein